MTTECNYNGCENDATVERLTIGSDLSMHYCPEHDPFNDERVAECFRTPKVGP